MRLVKRVTCEMERAHRWEGLWIDGRRHVTSVGSSEKKRDQNKQFVLMWKESFWRRFVKHLEDLVDVEEGEEVRESQVRMERSQVGMERSQVR